MITAEEFILNPKKVYMKTQPYQTLVLAYPDVKQKSSQLSIINRVRSKEHNEAHINANLSEQDSGVDVDKNWVRNSNRRADQVLKTLSSLLSHSKYLKCDYIVDLIKMSNRVLIAEDEKLLIDNSPNEINAFAFVYNVQQPTKKIESPVYFDLLKVLQIKKEQEINSNANTSIRKNSTKTATKKKSRDYIKEKSSKFQKPKEQRRPESKGEIIEDEGISYEKEEERR